MASTAKSKVKYSKSETALLKMLARGRRISSVELTDRLYENGNRPYHARHSMNTIMTSLIKKVEYNRESFKIVKSDPAGPHSMEYAKVER